MCRLFAFRAQKERDLHEALVQADNALLNQSLRHPDGWGVGYYIDSFPHLIKSTKTAMHDVLFESTSGVLASPTVLAHLRKATHGNKNVLNTHPFQFGAWTFIHNGHIKQFETKREALLAKIPKKLKRFIQGDTDSEVLFFFLLSALSKVHPLNQIDYPQTKRDACIEKALHAIVDIIGPLNISQKIGPSKRGNYLTFILTNGDYMVAYQGGQPLLYQIQKRKKDLLFCSEPYKAKETWHTMKMGDMISVDSTMVLSHRTVTLQKK